MLLVLVGYFVPLCTTLVGRTTSDTSTKWQNGNRAPYRYGRILESLFSNVVDPAVVD